MKALPHILKIFRQKGYHIHSRAYQLNLVGIRSSSTRSGAFDDLLTVFFKNPKGRWHFYSYPATTDPGTYYLQHPLWKGTAILKAGQYLNAYGLGLHRGKYRALIQKHQPVEVIRDYNRDTLLDFQNGYTEKGFFGINIHRANPTGESKVIHKWSAGCQVLAKASDFQHLLFLAERHKRELGSNHFTYTLLDMRSLEKSRRKNRLLVASLIALGGTSLYLQRSRS